MNNKLAAFIVVIILVGIGILLVKNKTVAPTGEELNAITPPVLETNNISDAVATSTVREFTIDSVPFSYSPSKMTVSKGDTVKITLKNVNGIHDLKIDEFNAATRVLNPGETDTITFVADKAGTFEFYCSVGNHRAMGMVGTLTVSN